MKQLNAQQFRWLLIFSSILLLIGFIAPMLTISKFMLVKHSLSILIGVWQLLSEGQLFLFIILVLFSIVLPIAKIILLFNLLHPTTRHPNRRDKMLHLMHNYGRWAILYP